MFITSSADVGNPRPSAAVVAAKLREVDRRYSRMARRHAWPALTPNGRSRRELMPNLRLAEIEGLLAHRYGRVLPDDDDGRDSFGIIADHIAWMRGDVVGHVVAFARAWCPWMSADEATRIAEQRAAHPLKYGAQRLGWRLGLTKTERDLLDIRTFRYVGQTDDIMKAEKLAKDRDRKRRKRAERRAARPKPISQTKPWLAEGISRATWYRNRGKGRETKAVRHREGLVFIADAESLTRAEAAAKPQPVSTSIDIDASEHRPRLVLGGRMMLGDDDVGGRA